MRTDKPIPLIYSMEKLSKLEMMNGGIYDEIYIYIYDKNVFSIRCNIEIEFNI